MTEYEIKGRLDRMVDLFHEVVAKGTYPIKMDTRLQGNYVVKSRFLFFITTEQSATIKLQDRGVFDSAIMLDEEFLPPTEKDRCRKDLEKITNFIRSRLVRS